MAKDGGSGAEQRRRTPDRHEAEQEEVKQTTDIHDKGEELKEELDSLLDEIDEVLEENAEEFVKQYIQKGGE